MPFKQVTEQDLKGKGVIGQPAVPGLSVTEMQKSVEQVVREAAIPAHNQLCEQLEAEAAAADIGAAVPGQGDMPPETPKKLQSVLEAMLAWAKEKLGLKADKADTYTKQETEEKISEGISETGFEEAVQEAKQSAQEAKEYAESINPAQFAQAEEGVTTVNASKTQNTFDIDLPNSNQFVIVPNAAYATGDTFRIAGRAVAAMLPNGDSLPDAFFAANAKVMCLWADTVLYFVGGGGGTMPDNVMRYRMDDGTPGQQPEQTIWGQTSDGQDAYVHSCTKAVYNPETGKTLDEDFETMAIHTYTCVTSGTNHALTGTGNNIKFVADSDFAEGDTISVNGTAVTAQTQGGETLGDGAWASGAVVICWLNGTTLCFGGGTSFSQNKVVIDTAQFATGEYYKNTDGLVYPVYARLYRAPASTPQMPMDVNNLLKIIGFDCIYQNDYLSATKGDSFSSSGSVNSLAYIAGGTLYFSNKNVGSDAKVEWIVRYILGGTGA